MPALGFGTWPMRGIECAQSVGLALEAGYRHIDTAQFYQNEDAVGDAVRGSGVAREDIFLTTKVWTDRVANGVLQKSVDESLKKLKTDYVDLLLIHWPTDRVPFAEQMAALREVQKADKAKLISVSNFSVAQMKEVREDIGAPIAANQVEYHPFLSQKPVLEYARSHEMFVTAYAPLARGQVNDDPVIKEIADKHGKTPAQVTLRWLVQQSGVAAIPKAAGEKRIKENFDIFDFALNDDDMAEIFALGLKNQSIFSRGN